MKEINVLVIKGPGLLANKVNINDKHSKYTGLLYEIWKIVKNELSDKYTFKETFKEYSNYDKMVKLVHDGTYDIVIGPFQYTKNRMKYVHFSPSIILSKNSILAYDNLNIYTYFKTLFFDVFIKPFSILFILGLVFGYILYKFEPNRFSYLKNKNLSLRRAIITTTATFFGEAGYLAENSSLTTFSILFLFLVMIIAFFFTIYLNAYTTKKLLHLHKNYTINRNNLHKYTFLSPKGYNVAEQLKKAGAKIKYLDMSIPDIIKYYKKNRKKYNGIALGFFDAKSREGDGLNTNVSNLGFKEVCFVVSKRDDLFFEDINNSIIDIQENLYTERLCKAFIPHESHMCVL